LNFEVGDGEAGEVLPQDAVTILGLLFSIGHGVEVTIIFGEIAKAFFGDRSLQRAVGLELKAGGAPDGVEVGGKDRKLDDLAVRAFHKDAVSALQVMC
jgi:hypothetical protein